MAFLKRIFAGLILGVVFTGVMLGLIYLLRQMGLVDAPIDRELSIMIWIAATILALFAMMRRS